METRRIVRSRILATVAALRRGTFVRNVLLVGRGTLLGQAIVIGASPILTRLYAPDAFGVYAVYIAAVVVVGTIAGLRYDIPIPLARQDGTATVLAALSWLSVLVTATVTASILFLASVQNWITIPGDLGAVAIAGLYFIGVFGYGTYQMLNYWAIRRGMYTEMGTTRIIRGVAQVSIQVGLALIGGGGSASLIFGHAAGHMSGLVSIGRDLRRHLLDERISAARLRWAARRYRKFPMLSAPAAALGTIGLQLPTILLTIFIGPAAAGFYAIAQRVIGTPATLIGSAMSQVFLGDVLRHHASDSDRALRRYIQTVAVSAAIGVVPITLVAIGGPRLFEFVLGSGWHVAGDFVRILTPMFILQFAVYPVSQTLNGIGRPDMQLAYDVVRIVLGAGSLTVAGLLRAPVDVALIAYSAGMSLSYVLYVALGYRALLFLHTRRVPPL